MGIVMPTRPVRCYLVDKDERGTIHTGLATQSVDVDSLAAGEVLVRVQFS
jgi:hypothetical protein